MSKKQNQKNIVNDAIIKDIAEAVGSLEYGIVTIKVHETKIIQIDITEKKRFDDVWRIEGGGGI
ncbi:MAG: YezD family protein [Candidatus Omnitrophica bacterium]|nr:YezD family protein [Candidatus Omnitrophota bacterium]